MHIDWATLAAVAVVAAAAALTVVLLVAFALVGLSARSGRRVGGPDAAALRYAPRRRHGRRRALLARRRAHRLLWPVSDHRLSSRRPRREP